MKEKLEKAAPVKPVEPPKPKTEVKSVQVKLTREEREEFHGKILDALDAGERIEAEFDQVKSQYKAKIEEQKSRVITISSILRAGFEYRDKECIVVMKPKDRIKEFWRIDNCEMACTETMTANDFQLDLLEKEKIEKSNKANAFAADADTRIEPIKN